MTLDAMGDDKRPNLKGLTNNEFRNLLLQHEDNRTGIGGMAPETQEISVLPRSTLYHVIVAVALLTGGLNIGMNMGIIGPALPDLALQTGSTIPQATNIIIWRSFTYIFGSMLAALLLDYFHMDGYLMMAVSMVLQAVFLSCSVMVTDLIVMCALNAMANLFTTTLMSATTYLCFQMSRERSQMITQITFMTFNVGKAVSPFIATPFLAPEHRPNTTMDSVNINQNLNVDEMRETNVANVFYIISIFSLALSMVNVGVFVANGCIIFGTAVKRAKHETIPGLELSKTRTVLMLIGFTTMIFVQCGMETADAGLITSYVSEYLHLGKTLGVAITGMYQGVKVIACLIVITVVSRIFTSVILMIDILLLIISTLAMTLIIIFQLPSGYLWASIVIMAFGSSNYLATQVSWLETRRPITGQISAMICISFGLGGMLLPWITTTLLTCYGKVGFPFVMLVSSCILLVLFIFIKLSMKEEWFPTIRQMHSTLDTETEVLIKENSPDKYTEERVHTQ